MGDEREKYCTYIYYNNNSIHLSQWHEFRRSVTSSTVSNWSISNGEFTQVVTNHFWFDFNSVENFTIVNTDNRTNHFWNNDHVSQVSFDSSWSFIWLSVSSGNSQFLIKPIGLESKPLENLLLTLAPHNLVNSSVGISTKSFKSTPLNENCLKVLFLEQL